MSQASTHTLKGRHGPSRSLARLALFWCALALSVQGCATDRTGGLSEPEADIEAVQLWAHPDTLGIEVYAPLDFKAASREVAWAIDGVARGVMRYRPSVGEYGVFGFLDQPPAEVVSPARLAIAENTGIFVFDDSTGRVDLYTPGGQHLRSFDPGTRPSIFEVSRRPLRLTYGTRTFVDDSIPTLTVIQTGFLGEDADTLLSPDVGPETLRNAPAVRGRLVSTPAFGGLWVFSRTATDTVFELAAVGPQRKLALPEADTLRAGILADLQQEILWVVSPLPEGGLEYEAYDLSVEAVNGIIDGARAYLGARTTPLSFTGQVAFDGSVSGWWRGERGFYSPRGFDMRIEELREGADAARQTRAARRAAIAETWEAALQAASEAREQEQQDLEEIRKEEGLE